MTAGRVPWPGALALGVLALAVATFIRAYAAPAPAHFFDYDQRVYLAMARAPFSDDPLVHRPWQCWRPLVPLVAHYAGMLLGGPERAFLALTFATLALLPLAACWWLTSLGVSTASALAGAAIMAVAPPTVGLLAWDVVRVDPVALMLMFLVAGATVRGHGAAATIGVAVMAFTKETAVVAACFVVAWAVLVDRRLRAAACLSIALALSTRLALQRWIPADPAYPFDNLKDFRVIVASLSPAYAARRLLLATAGTWNALLPLVAAAMASRRWGGRELAFTVAIAATMGQLVFATDNERLMATAYPFVLAWVALRLDDARPRTRVAIAVALAAAQLPWLLELGRVWPVPVDDAIPHWPAIRFAEIGLVAASLAGAAAALWHQESGGRAAAV